MNKTNKNNIDSLSKITTLLVFIVFQICYAIDRSAELVRIMNRLGDSLIGVVHRIIVWTSASSCFGPSVDMVLLCEVTRWYIDSPFFPLIWSFPTGLITLEKGEVGLFGDLPSGFGDLQAIISSFFSTFMSLFAIVHSFLQTSNT